MSWFELARVNVHCHKKGTDLTGRADDIIKRPNFWYTADGIYTRSMEYDEFFAETEDGRWLIMQDMAEITVEGIPSAEDSTFSAVNDALQNNSLDDVFENEHVRFWQWAREHRPDGVDFPDDLSYLIICEIDTCEHMTSWGPDEYFVFEKVWKLDLNKIGQGLKVATPAR